MEKNKKPKSDEEKEEISFPAATEKKEDLPPPTPPIETVDLTELLGQKTQIKEFKTSEEKPNDDDFDEELDTEEEPTEDEEPTEEQPNVEKKQVLSPTQNAKVIIGTLDSLQKMIYPVAYGKKKFTAEQKKLLPTVKALYQLNKSTAFAAMLAEQSEEIKVVYELYCEYKKYCKEEVPFDKEEKELLTVPLAAVFQKHGWDTGPEAALIMALLTTSATRILPLFI